MLKRLIQGYLVGLANIIPGVSGGTMALVLGIYPRLLTALGNFDSAALGSLWRVLSGRPGSRSDMLHTLRRLDAVFLLWLGAGALTAVFSLSRLMTYLLHRHLTLTYAFFFGLILASVVFPYRLLRRRGLKEALVCLAAAAATVSLTLSVDEERTMNKAEHKAAMVAQRTVAAADFALNEQTEDAPSSRFRLEIPEAGKAARFFGGAALAVAAMILPGVSGSFVLLLLGVYFDLLRSVNDRDLLLLLVFMAGGMFGLLALARVVGACLKRNFDLTMSAMVGLMLGSLWGLWPFKRYMIITDELFMLGNRWPTPGSEFLAAAVLFMLGVGLVTLFVKLGASDS